MQGVERHALYRHPERGRDPNRRRACSEERGAAKKALIEPGWLDELPNRSLPYTSTIIFVVRKGNPKGIKDWPDLIQPGVQVITPNPKTSGNGYLSFFSAWGAVTLRGGSRDDAVKYVTELYKHLEVREAKGELELVYPPSSIRAEPHVAVVDGNVDRKKTRAAAEAYLKFTYTEEGQEIAAKHFYRPSNEAVLKKHAGAFPELRLFPVTDIAKDFHDAHRQFIAEGGVFDGIYKPKN